MTGRIAQYKVSDEEDCAIMSGAKEALDIDWNYLSSCLPSTVFEDLVQTLQGPVGQIISV